MQNKRTVSFQRDQSGSFQWERSSHTMATHLVNDDGEFMQGLFNGLGQAIVGIPQQQQDNSQAQLQQLMQAQAKSLF